MFSTHLGGRSLLDRSELERPLGFDDLRPPEAPLRVERKLVTPRKQVGLRSGAERLLEDGREAVPQGAPEHRSEEEGEHRRWGGFGNAKQAVAAHGAS